jgi:hypothetical protein
LDAVLLRVDGARLAVASVGRREAFSDFAARPVADVAALPALAGLAVARTVLPVADAGRPCALPDGRDGRSSASRSRSAAFADLAAAFAARAALLVGLPMIADLAVAPPVLPRAVTALLAACVD